MTLHSAKGLEFPHVFISGLEEGLFPSYMSITSDDATELEEERRLCYVGITRAEEELTITCAKQRMVRGETQYNAPSRFIREIPAELMDMKIPGGMVSRTADSFDLAGQGYTKEIFSRKPSAASPANRSAHARPFIASANKTANEVSVLAGERYNSGRGTGSIRLNNGFTKSGSKPAIALGRDIGSSDAPDYEVGDTVRHVKFGEGVVKKLEKGARDYEGTVDFKGAGIKKMFAGFAKLKRI